jgi:hypothetical protein
MSTIALTMSPAPELVGCGGEAGGSEAAPHAEIATIMTSEAVPAIAILGNEKYIRTSSHGVTRGADFRAGEHDETLVSMRPKSR